MDTKTQVNVSECNNWTVENIAEQGSGRIEMSAYASGTVETSDGHFVTLRKPAKSAANSRNTHITMATKEHGEMVSESKFELVF